MQTATSPARNGDAEGTLSLEDELDRIFAEPRKPLRGAERAAEIEEARRCIGGALAKMVTEHGAQGAREAEPETNADGEDHAKAQAEPEANATFKMPLPFVDVHYADLDDTNPEPPAFVLADLIPIGHVTGLFSHGGGGKTTLALMLAIAVALGIMLFGKATRKGPVVFYSGEDGAARLRYLLKYVCSAMGVNVADLEGKLFILDATDNDPTLFAEVSIAGQQRKGMPTSVYHALAAFCKQKSASLLIIDNASDVYDASEIERAKVRGFMRALAKIARECNAGVLLLAHVDKATARQERVGGESYSGSTAWHNSARGRLFLWREDDGTLVLKQQKNNLGRLCDPIRLTWPENGVPMLAAAQDQDRAVRTLLRLIMEFYGRREYVATAHNSPNNAPRLLSRDRDYPAGLKPAQVHSMLRDAERSLLIVRERYRTDFRNERERWNLTDAGREFAGVDGAGVF